MLNILPFLYIVNRSLKNFTTNTLANSR